MTPLTPDEVVERIAYPAVDSLEELRRHLLYMERAGLVVVDATDTPNEPSVYEEASDRVPEALRAKVASALLDLDAKLSTGGSPGERGTVTQQTSAPPRDLSPDEVVEHVTKARGSLSPSAEDSLRHNRLLLATAGLDVIPRETPPFPGAYPGPQVDGQPTWGAVYDDMPAFEWQWSIDGKDWKIPPSHPANPKRWVLVRRTPQPAAPPERWTVEHPDGVAAGLLLDGGTVCAHVYHPFDADAIARKLNAVEVLVENEKTGT